MDVRDAHAWDAKLAGDRLGSFALTDRSLVRALLTSAALAAGVLLAGCDTDGISLATAPRRCAALAENCWPRSKQKNMDKESPILVRLFKEEAELEVWKQDAPAASRC